jgi:alkyl sulfatase BDS1-like metallo-beta-lactamase superfamily hydrolase
MEQSRPSITVLDAHKRASTGFPFEDTDDFEAARRGFIAPLKPGVLRAADGHPVWDNDRYAFVTGDAPDTVHPSLWRQAQLLGIQGLFEVVDGIYQVRGLDLSNISFVEGERGVIVIDPLISAETATAALDLYRAHRGERPVTAVIYTHSHVDHFGGVRGVISQEDVDSGRVQVIAPAGFVEAAVSENVYAGPAMARRSAYMYGAALPAGRAGQVGAGLGQTVSTGSVTLIRPTFDITYTGQVVLTVDGVEMEFQMAPDSEAPAEMHFYFPQRHALCMAENATHTLHNLLTLRGAPVRDSLGWSKYLTEAIERFGDRSDVVFASHHWPTWRREQVVQFLSLQRDLYAYLHDQTLRLMNQGYTGLEIAEQIQLPPARRRPTLTPLRSVSHNVKAIYQRYMGWFDGNPARLWQHTPENAAKRYVSAMGGVESVITQAQSAFDEGDLRWAATILDHAVFADPSNDAARSLLARTLEQLAYATENGPWRNFFLSGAVELRGGSFGTPTSASSPDLLGQLTIEQFFDALAIQVDGPRAWDLSIETDWTFTDVNENHHVTLRNGVLTHVRKAPNSSRGRGHQATRADLPR